MFSQSATLKGPEDEFDTWSAVNVDMDETDVSDWKRSHMRLARFTVAFTYALLAHTDIICYMLMILNHMVYASLLSMPLPFLLFMWGMLSIPRPTKMFWITVITYTQIVIVIKYLFKFQFFQMSDCNEDGLEKNSPLCPPKIWGIERDGHTSAYDLLLLLAMFFHRYSLKVGVFSLTAHQNTFEWGTPSMPGFVLPSFFPSFLPSFLPLLSRASLLPGVRLGTDLGLTNSPLLLQVHGLWRDKARGSDGDETDEPPLSPTTPSGTSMPIRCDSTCTYPRRKLGLPRRCNQTKERNINWYTSLIITHHQHAI